MNAINFVEQATQSGIASANYSGAVTNKAYLTLEWLSTESICELESGKTYNLGVCITEDVLQGSSIELGSHLELRLIPSQSYVNIQTIMPELDWSDEIIYEFEVTIADDTPCCELKLILYKNRNRRSPLVLTEISITIKGDRHLIDKENLKTCHINDERLPDNTAILRVTGSNSLLSGQEQYQYQLLYLSQSGKPEQLQVLANPLLSLGFKKTEFAHIRDEMLEFSRSHVQSEFKKALRRLFKAQDDIACLVIVDYVFSEIPWEMLHLGEDDYLGTAVNVVRWFPFQDDFDEVQLNVKERAIEGETLAYLNNEVVGKNEKQILKGLMCEYPDKAQDLSVRLRQSLADVGLVYLSCHGHFTYGDAYQINFGSGEDVDNQVKLLELERISCRHDLRPVFFLNACHSGRLYMKNGRLVGLPEVLLARAACDYIGTLGAVGSDFAAKVACGIFEKATSDNGVHLSDELRLLRLGAVNNLKEEESELHWFNFIDAFSYVYYGNPLTRLKLKLKVVEDK